jgi:hypothetical protein
MDPSAYALHFGDIVSTESDVESMQFCMDFIKRCFALEKANPTEWDGLLDGTKNEFTAHFYFSSAYIFAEDISTILVNKLSEREHSPDDILYHPRIMDVMVEVMWWRHFGSEHGNEGSVANAKIRDIVEPLGPVVTVDGRKVPHYLDILEVWNRTNLSIDEGVPPSIEEVD